MVCKVADTADGDKMVLLAAISFQFAPSSSKLQLALPHCRRGNNVSSMVRRIVSRMGGNRLITREKRLYVPPVDLDTM